MSQKYICPHFYKSSKQRGHLSDALQVMDYPRVTLPYYRKAQFVTVQSLDGLGRKLASIKNTFNLKEGSLDVCAQSIVSECQPGDFVAFQSGFFNQTHVLNIIQNREQDTLLVLDSCFSGSWVEKSIKQCLRQKCGRIVIQTSCAADQEAYGMAFTPALHYINDLSEDEFKALIQEFNDRISDDGNLFCRAVFNIRGYMIRLCPMVLLTFLLNFTASDYSTRNNFLDSYAQR